MSIFDERLNKILGRVDHLKTKENPEGNLFFHNNLSVEEAKQAIKQLVADEMSELLEQSIKGAYSGSDAIDRLRTKLAEWLKETV